MVLPGLALPDDIDALKAMILSMAREQAASEARIAVAEVRIAASEAEVARLKAVEKSANERIANLTSILKVLQRTQHGTRSERLRLAIDDEQASFAFEEVETGLSEIRSELDRGREQAEARPAFAQGLCCPPRTHRGCRRAGNPGRLRGAGRRAAEVPGHCHAPSQCRGAVTAWSRLWRRRKSLKAACRRTGCSPTSPCRNTPTVAEPVRQWLPIVLKTAEAQMYAASTPH